jgi:hypothetical protein
MKRFRPNLSISVGMLALTLSGGLKAQSAASEKASAEALFDHGVALVAAGNYADGCAQLEASQALEQTLGTELRLADCYERLGKTASAWALFKESEQLAHRQNEGTREELARVRAAALVRQLSYLVLDTSGDPPPGFVVERNGHPVPLASLSVAIPVDPGPQDITARAPLHRSWATHVSVARAAGTLNITIPSLHVLAPGPAQPLARDDNGNTQRAIGITATVVGFVGIVTGVGLGLYAKRENDESKRSCTTDSLDACTSAGANLRQRADQFGSASTVTLVAGGAVLAGGILLWSTTPSRAEQKPAAKLRLNTAFSKDSFQTVLRGSF